MNKYNLCSYIYVVLLALALPVTFNRGDGSGVQPNKMVGSLSCSQADVAVVTRSQTAAMQRKAELPQTTLASVANVTPSHPDKESDPVDDSVESSRASLFQNSKIADTIPFELVDRSELIRLQQSDPDLSSLFERRDVNNEVPSK